MDEAEQEWKKKECFGTNKTRKESSRFLLELKHRKEMTCDMYSTLPPTIPYSGSMADLSIAYRYITGRV
eukprot:scaffold201503_cov56-Attheya_sp.AAC.2